MKTKHIFIVLFFIIIWFFIKDYKSIIHSYQNSTRKPNGNLVNGRKEGEWKTHYLNGKLQTIAHYKNDKLNGPYLSYYPNGNFRYKGTYKMGLTIDSAIMYYSNGRINSAEYHDTTGREQGVFKIYHKNGNLIQIGKFKDGHLTDTSRIYFESGHLKTLEFYADNKKAGQWKYYNETGQLTKTEVYKNDSLIITQQAR